MLSLARLTFTPEIEKKVPTVMPMVYTVKWLSEKAEDDRRGRTNYQIESEVSKPKPMRHHPSLPAHRPSVPNRNLSVAQLSLANNR